MSREKILALQTQLDQAKHELFVSRLNRIEQIPVQISQIVFDITDASNYKIQYTHTTNEFCDSIYEDCIRPCESQNTYKKETIVTFGRNPKYYFTGHKSFSIYKNSYGVIRVKEANSTVDISESQERMLLYSLNDNIPESYMLRFINYIINNKWDDTSVVVHFSVV